MTENEAGDEEWETTDFTLLYYYTLFDDSEWEDYKCQLTLVIYEIEDDVVKNELKEICYTLLEVFKDNVKEPDEN